MQYLPYLGIVALRRFQFTLLMPALVDLRVTYRVSGYPRIYLYRWWCVWGHADALISFPLVIRLLRPTLPYHRVP